MKDKISIKTQTPRSTRFFEDFADNINLFYKDFEMGIITTKRWGDFSEKGKVIITFTFNGDEYEFKLSELKQIIKHVIIYNKGLKLNNDDSNNLNVEEKIERYVNDIFENEYDSKEFIKECVREHYEREFKGE